MNSSALGDLSPDLVRQTLLDAAEIAAATPCPASAPPSLSTTRRPAGFDPVTEADSEAELAIRALLGERFPDHAIIGEEWDDKAGTGRYAWIIDPIDGTRAFITGVPVWGTLIGLTIDGRAVAGLMAQPFTGEIFMSLPGEAALPPRHRRRRSAPRRSPNSAAPRLTATSPDLFETTRGTVARLEPHPQGRPHHPLRPRLLRLRAPGRRPHRPRGRGRAQERRHLPADPADRERRRRRHHLGRRPGRSGRQLRRRRNAGTARCSDGGAEGVEAARRPSPLAERAEGGGSA